MGYIITYEQANGKCYQIKRKRRIGIKKFAIALMIVVLAFLMVNTKARVQLKNFILPGDAQVTEAALNELVSSIKDGVAFDDAVTAFCREIIDSAAE